MKPRSVTPPEDASPFADGAAAADYIATMAKSLSAIASRHGLDTLSYLLDVATLEAEQKRTR
jgi:N-acyl-D-aspartate/D-glutamate deacylase